MILPSVSSPVSMMTYIDWPQSVARSARQNSRPSMIGISQSVMTICGMTCSARDRACWPFSAVYTAPPSRWHSTPSVSMRVVGSSSTSNTRARTWPFAVSCSGRGTGALAMASNDGSGPTGIFSNSAHSCQIRTTRSKTSPRPVASSPILLPRSISSEMFPWRSVTADRPRSAIRLAWKNR
jgi:hypothetical protein